VNTRTPAPTSTTAPGTNCTVYSDSDDCRLGDRVQRGPHWIRDDQDNGNSLGTAKGPPDKRREISIFEALLPKKRKGWCTVRWDGKTTNNDYRTSSLCRAPWSITWVDILWTVFALVCEVWVAGSILCAYNGDDFGGAVCGVCFILFPVSAGCTLGKLFPPSNGYIGCSSLQCEKAVHNAVMTLECFPFDLIETCSFHVKAKEEPAPESGHVSNSHG
jgi:hypothetical protein